ncbi:hypothetical protein BLNAU_20098 [Blattamonas nauphoetae]|uniref:Uncharacterized protein n=1 Tax=Blattamonas nauphoetae TaxID=2049346 RepID=A0ABQ9X3T8_9EUKA|nr:hypothetical protein BLNAU_20098 [Blattamonas nauphoetae]
MSLFSLAKTIQCPICSDTTHVSKAADHFKSICLESLPSVYDPNFSILVPNPIMCPICFECGIERELNIFDLVTHIELHVRLEQIGKGREPAKAIQQELTKLGEERAEVDIIEWILNNTDLSSDRNFRHSTSKLRRKSHPNAFDLFAAFLANKRKQRQERKNASEISAELPKNDPSQPLLENDESKVTKEGKQKQNCADGIKEDEYAFLNKPNRIWLENDDLNELSPESCPELNLISLFEEEMSGDVSEVHEIEHKEVEETKMEEVKNEIQAREKAKKRRRRGRKGRQHRRNHRR